MADKRQPLRENSVNNSDSTSSDREIWQEDFAHPKRSRSSRKQRKAARGNTRPPQQLSGDEALQRRLDAIDQRKARGSALKMVLFVFFTLTLTVFMIYMILSGTHPQPQLHVIQFERVRETVTSAALLKREEVLLTAPSSGFFRPVAAEGERRSVRGLIGYIVPEAYEDLLHEAEALEREISKRQLELIRDGNHEQILGPYLVWDRQILPLVEQIRYQASEPSLNDIRSFNLAMDSVIHLRSRSLLLENYGDSELESLISEYNRAERALASYSTAITSPEAGHLSYLLDDDMLTMSREDLTTGDTTSSDVTGETGLSVQELEGLLEDGNQLTLRKAQAEEGDVIARVVTGAWQELHYLLPADRHWELGASYSIDVPAEGITIDNCELISSRTADNRVHLIFRTDQQVERLAGREIISTRIESFSQPALRIPIEAVIVDPRSQDLIQPELTQDAEMFIGPPRYEDSDKAPDSSDGNPVSARGRTSIYRLESGYVNQIPVEVISETDTFALVRSPEGIAAPLAEGQIIILNPDSSTPGEALGD